MKSKELGELLRICRGEMTQEQLARMLHLDRTMISKIENGRIEPDMETIRRWLKATYDHWRRMKKFETILVQVKQIVETDEIGA